MRAVPSCDHSTRVSRLAGCSKLAPALAPRLLCIAKFYLQISTFVEPTSGLEPLTCSLRVIHQVLQGCARDCKSRINKPVSFLSFAKCCIVLRSRWYQS